MYRNNVTIVQVFIKQRHLEGKNSGRSLSDSGFVGSSYISVTFSFVAINLISITLHTNNHPPS